MSPLPITIRPERPEDYARVFEIHSAAFGRDGEARLAQRFTGPERCRRGFWLGFAASATGPGVGGTSE